MAVYLLKYSAPAGNPNKRYASARYYIGFAEDWRLADRIKEHRRGTSRAALPTWFHEQGISFKVVRIWPGKGRRFERRLKSSGHYYRHDPTSPRCTQKTRAWAESTASSITVDEVAEPKVRQVAEPTFAPAMAALPF